MKELRIAYLDSGNAADLEFSNSKERDEQVLKHDDVELYTLEEFICAFNNEEISDLGYAVITQYPEKDNGGNIAVQKITYVKAFAKAINELQEYAWATGEGQACVSADTLLEDFESDDKEVQSLVDDVLTKASNCDIIFHL